MIEKFKLERIQSSFENISSNQTYVNDVVSSINSDFYLTNYLLTIQKNYASETVFPSLFVIDSFNLHNMLYKISPEVSSKINLTLYCFNEEQQIRYLQDEFKKIEEKNPYFAKGLNILISKFKDPGESIIIYKLLENQYNFQHKKPIFLN